MLVKKSKKLVYINTKYNILSKQMIFYFCKNNVLSTTFVSIEVFRKYVGRKNIDYIIKLGLHPDLPNSAISDIKKNIISDVSLIVGCQQNKVGVITYTYVDKENI